MGFKVNEMVNTGGFPFYLIDGLRKEFTIDYFIETGTAGGLTIKEAAKHFKKCWTIELIKGRPEVEDFDNVEWLEGHSVDLLLPLVNEFIGKKNAMQEVDQPSKYLYVAFWLDAHWSEPYKNNTGYKECYILEELEIISGYQDSAVIFIDDARLFMGHPPAPNNPQDWPSIQEIFCLLKEKFPYNYSTVIDDYIISIPERMREPIDREWRANYPIRYPSAETKLKMEAKNVFNAIKKYVE